LFDAGLSIYVGNGREGKTTLETLYKVLIAFCIIFFAAGIFYVVYYLPKVPTTPAQPQSSTGSYSVAGDRLEY